MPKARKESGRKKAARSATKSKNEVDVKPTHLSRGKKKRLEAKERYLKKADLIKYLASATKEFQRKDEASKIGPLASMEGLQKELHKMSSTLELKTIDAKLTKLRLELHKNNLTAKELARDEKIGFTRFYEILNDPKFQMNPYLYAYTICSEHAKHVESKKLEFQALKDTKSQAGSMIA